MLSNAYFLAKFRFDTAENELAKNMQNFANFANFANLASAHEARPLRAGSAGQQRDREQARVRGEGLLYFNFFRAAKNRGSEFLNLLEARPRPYQTEVPN